MTRAVPDQGANATGAGLPPKALFSVFDKTGAAQFAAGLVDLGWEILASGGTATALANEGVAVTDVAEHTGTPAMLGHRVVTLHPRIHGGILADRSNPQHWADLAAHVIEPIDLVVVNLYPFDRHPDTETIDIGGPTLLRAAAKNHAHVGVVCDPADYQPVLDELARASGLSDATRRRLARRAFAEASAHDAAIIGWFDAGSDDLPESVHLVMERAESLRYGENPDQRAARYRRWGGAGFFDRVTQHGGAALSYLNLVDADAAWSLACNLGELGAGFGHDDEFGQGAAVIVKHANPCGAAVAGTVADAYQRAFDCDPQSAFGGVVAINGVVDHDTAELMAAAAQADVVIAAGFAQGVRERLHERRAATRILEAPVGEWGAGERRYELRQLSDALLVQDARSQATDPRRWRVVTARQPTADETNDALLAWTVCAAVTSNAVVLARNGVAWGIGAGQPNRAEAGRIATNKAAGRASGGACASDAFYPFPDGIHAAAEAGVAVVVQPGGSMNDPKVIAAADDLGLAMLFTGERRFRH